MPVNLTKTSLHFRVLQNSFAAGSAGSCCTVPDSIPKENTMKKGFFTCLLYTLFPMLLLAGFTPPDKLQVPSISIPVVFGLSDKPTVLYLPNSCSGLIGDAVAGEGRLTVSVQGRIQNGQLAVQIKVDYKGTAITTVGNVAYSINGNMSVSETRTILSEPVDIFVKGAFKLIGKQKSPNLQLSDFGYVTIHPNGMVVNHLLDPDNDPSYSHPKIYCSSQTEK